MTHLTIELPDRLYQRAQSFAKSHAISLENIVLDALESYIEAEEREPTQAEVLQGLREGLQDALSGRVRSAHEVFADLDTVQ